MTKLQKKLFPITYFVSKYKFKSVMLISLMFVAGIFEGIGFSAFLPLLNIVTGSEVSNDSTLSRMIINILDVFGFQPTLIPVLCLILVTTLVKSGLTFLSLYQINKIGIEVVGNLRKELISGIFKASWAFSSQKKAGDLSMILAHEINESSDAYLAGTRGLSFIIQIMVFGSVAMVLSWQITIMAFVMTIILWVTLKKFISITREASQDQSNLGRELISLFVDFIKGLKPVKASGQNKVVEGLLNNKVDKHCNAQYRRTFAALGLQYLQEPIQVLVICIGVYFLLAIMQMKFEEFALLIMVFYKTAQRLSNIQSYYQTFIAAFPSFWASYKAINSAHNAAEIETGGIDFKFDKDIEFKDVHVTRGDKEVLKGVNLKINKGEFITFVGPSGSGKTTLVDLLAKLVEYQQGEVLIDGKSVKEMNIKSLRNRLGYMAQDSFIFHDSIRNNITFFDDSITDEMIHESLRAAGIKDVVDDLDKGLDENMGESGNRFSGGQKQRFILARTLLKGADILILDESTSALDEKSEAVILESLKALKGKVTVLSVAHQGKLASLADRVIRISDGNLSEQTA